MLTMLLSQLNGDLLTAGREEAFTSTDVLESCGAQS